jgi:hypothetical protein
MEKVDNLINALNQFKSDYPSITSGDLQSFILGWQSAEKYLKPASENKPFFVDMLGEKSMLLDEGVLVGAYHFLFYGHSQNYTPAHKADRMRAIFKDSIQPCVSFKNWVKCIEFLNHCVKLENKVL